MDDRIKRILRSAVQCYGLEFTENTRLCMAYLADLMPAYPHERRQLVAAVRLGIPSQWREQGGHHLARLVHNLATAQNLSESEARQVVDAWGYALGQSALAVKPPRVIRVRGVGSYLGGLLTGVVVLVLGSALAFYRSPEPLSQPLSEAVRIALPSPAIEQAFNVPVAKPEPKSETLARQSLWLYLDAPELDNPSYPTLLPITRERVEPRPVARAPEQVTKKVTKVAPSVTPVAVNKPQEPALRVTPEPLQLKEVAKVVHTPPKLLKDNTNGSIIKDGVLTLADDTRPVTGNTDQQPVVIPPQRLVRSDQHLKKLLDAALQDLVTFNLKAQTLQKKKADLLAVQELLKINQDGFYRKQHQQVQSQINGLQARLDLLSESYSQRLNALCNMASNNQAWSEQNMLLKKSSAGQLLQRHWRECSNLSQQQVRERLLAAHGMTRRP